MTKKLKIRFVKFERALAMQILKQNGKFKSREHIRIGYAPAFEGNYIYLRGGDSEYDNSLSCKDFFSNAERDEYLNNVIKWISEEQFSTSRKLEIGEECLFSDDSNNWISGNYAGKCAKQLGEPHFLKLDSDTSLSRWRYVKSLYGAPKIDGDVYTWEMEVSE